MAPRGSRNGRWKGADASATAIHEWLRKHHPKTGVCEECGASGLTHYAFQHHGVKAYTRARTDYRELCPACHNRFDKAGWEHGTIYGYVRKSCRCDLCRTAWREYFRGARERRANAIT